MHNDAISIHVIKCVLMGQNQLYMSKFFHMKFNIPVFRPHLVLQIRENKTSISCLRPKLLNFKLVKPHI